MGNWQQALHRPGATALTNRLIKEDSDLGYLLPSDSVICDNVSNNVSCLNVLAPVFQPMSVSDDSVSECFSPEKGVLSQVGKEGRCLSVKHLLSLRGFRHSLTVCPDEDLVQFVLDGIREGMHLGSLDGIL